MSLVLCCTANRGLRTVIGRNLSYMHQSSATLPLAGRPYHPACTPALWQLYASGAAASPLVGYY